jgi:ATP:ADP antiporter, AAA family
MVLLVGAAALLEIAVFSAGRLSRLSATLHGEPRAAEAPIGGGVLAGITHVVRSPYLLNVAVFLLLFSITSTFLYFQQAAIVSGAFRDRGAQTEFFATVDLLVNVLTLVVQLLFTARIVLLLGVALTLAVLPALTIVGFGALALVPTVLAIAVFQVIRRAADYAVARPARELLYTVASREDRYKAKSLIDTVVYRTGDQVGAWSVALLRAVGFGAAQVSFAAIPLAALWLVNALWLGRRQERLATTQATSRELRAAPVSRETTRNAPGLTGT